MGCGPIVCGCFNRDSMGSELRCDVCCVVVGVEFNHVVQTGVGSWRQRDETFSVKANDVISDDVVSLPVGATGAAKVAI